MPSRTTIGDIDLATAKDTTRLYEMFNFKQSKRLMIGNIRMFVNRVNPDGRHLCFGCDRPGHFQRTCSKIQSLDWNGATSAGAIKSSIKLVGLVEDQHEAFDPMHLRSMGTSSTTVGRVAKEEAVNDQLR